LSSTTRRLAAIVFTDIVGYAALAQRNEPLAMELLEKHNASIRAVVREHRGREVKTMGDAFLLEFDSALEAVLCAIDIQRRFKERNESAPSGSAILLRVGIHVGDVIHRDNDVFGDAVNIASRIVAIAESGGICISEEVYGQVRNKIEYPMTKLLEQRLKNVELEMDLYEVVLPWEANGARAASQKRNRIAVLPFANISPDPTDSYFAEGLTDEVISTLSGLKGLRVIARTSVNRYRSTEKGAKQIGNELQVGHILEGSVRRAGNKIRVSAQLIEVESQEHVWSSQYDRDLDNIFSIQSDIARSVADSLNEKLMTAEKARIERRDTESLGAYVAYLKGRTLLHESSEKAIKGAEAEFSLAVKEDPSYAKAYAGLADTKMLLGDNLFAPFPTSLSEAKVFIDKALELDPELAEARASFANYLMFEYRFDEAEKEFRRSIALNPSYATAHHLYGYCLSTFGRQDEALREVLVAEDLDPLSSVITLSAVYRLADMDKNKEALRRISKLSEIDPEGPLVTEALMVFHFRNKNWVEAEKYLDQMVQADPTDPYLDANMAYLLAATGRRDEALKAIEKIMVVPDSARIRGTLLAFAYAGLGDLDECFRWLNYGVDNREALFSFFRSFPLFEEVRQDPRFGQLLAKANL
jgi:adenylate cyclase